MWNAATPEKWRRRRMKMNSSPAISTTKPVTWMR